MLYGSLGANAARIASDLTDAKTTYDNSITRLTERFEERQSAINASTKFHRRSQQAGEDILDFVTELKQLATYCIFGAVELDNFRDWLVAGALTTRSESDTSQSLRTERSRTRSSSRRRSSAPPLNRIGSARRPEAMNPTLVY